MQGALENDALGDKLRRVLVHHANLLCCLPGSQHHAWVAGFKPPVAVLVERRGRDAIACLTTFREISSNRESQCVLPVAIEERHWREKNDKDVLAATAPVRLKEALRERQFLRFNLGSYASAVALDA